MSRPPKPPKVPPVVTPNRKDHASKPMTPAEVRRAEAAHAINLPRMRDLEFHDRIVRHSTHPTCAAALMPIQPGQFVPRLGNYATLAEEALRKGAQGSEPSWLLDILHCFGGRIPGLTVVALRLAWRDGNGRWLHPIAVGREAEILSRLVLAQFRAERVSARHEPVRFGGKLSAHLVKLRKLGFEIDNQDERYPAGRGWSVTHGLRSPILIVAFDVFDPAR